MKKFLIIGAGPTGLGAATKLSGLKHNNWLILEKNPYVGGLSSSFLDNRSFTWDIGGHVLFSHYPYFTSIVNKVLKNEQIAHLRKSYIRILNNWIPYPFQNNIKNLPSKELLDCLIGLYEAASKKQANSLNFKEWIVNTFGEGIAKYFMLPYNFKVWATPLEFMDKKWIGERVSVINFKKILENVILNKDDVSWGPNNKFIFPQSGGTGEIFKRISKPLLNNIKFNAEVTKIDMKNKKVYLHNGETYGYDYLINTSPLDLFVKNISPKNKKLIKLTHNLRHISGFVIGIGFNKPIHEDICWAYFPEKISPFYRITYFHNYSYNNIPNGNTNKYSSIMCETSFSEFKKEPDDTIINKTIKGLINSGIIKNKDSKNIISKYKLTVPYTYPVPTLKRDESLKILQPYLETHNVFSRGRFGGWKYEVGNMDHSFMMGVEVIEKILKNKDEETYNWRS